MAVEDHVVMDNPTNNFLTWNPLDKARDNTVLSNGNLTSTDTSSGYSTHYGNIVVPSSGLYYVEFTIKTFGSSNAVGIYVGNNRTWPNIYTSTGYPYDANTFMLMHNGLIYYNGTAGGNTYHPTFAAGDVIALVIDGGSRNVWLRKNGSLTSGDNYTTGSQSGGVVGALTAISALPDGDMYVFTMASGAAASGYSTSAIVMNAGQDRTFGGYPNSLATSSGYSDANGHGDFYYQPPTGALALCTQNIPTPSIDSAVGNEPEDFFKCLTYSGTGTTKTISSLTFQPDFVWLKDRDDNGDFHQIYDSVRGAAKVIFSNSNLQQYDRSDGLTSFNSDGFSLGSHPHNNDVSNYIAWCWRAGGAPSGATSATGSAKRINTSGTQDDTSCSALASATSATITPTLMSINQKAGFSIIKYSGNSTANATVPHGLNSKVEFSMVKVLNDSQAWSVYHKDAGGGLILNLTNAAGSSYDHSASGDNLVSFSSGWDGVNGGYNYIMYAFTSIEGYSAFGSYTGNGNADGPFVYTGFKPSFFLVKCIDSSSATDHWVILDNARDPNNTVRRKLYPNDSYDENDEAQYWGCDFLSNGVKIRNTWGGSNQSEKNYIYMAFAEQPINYANAR